MRLLATAGGLPNTIVENTRPWEWMGVLQLLSDPGQVRFIEVDGFGGNFFHASLDSVTGLIFVTPHARLDFEWFTASGRAPVVDFTLRFFMTDGTQAISASTFAVNLLDLDDTPPQALAFSSGGSVRAGVPGASIGRLSVTDPDTPGGHSFRLMDGDSWQFEVVGNELRLRPGVRLELGDGPQRDIIIEVLDGRQSAAFQLSIDILPDPAVGTTPVEVLLPGLNRLGLEWLTPNGVGGGLPNWALQSVEQGGGLIKVETQSGGEVWFERPAWIDLTSGFVDFGSTGHAARIWLAYETVYDRPPRLSEMQAIAHDMERWGLTENFLLHWMMHISGEGRSLLSLSSRDFVIEIYGNVVSWPQIESTISFHANRLDNGVISREGFVQNIMNWRMRFNDFNSQVADGFFVPRQHMKEIGALFQAGMNLPLDSNGWWWFEMIDQGRASLRQLAGDIMTTQPFQAKWGGMTNAAFVAGFFQEVTNQTFDDVAVRAWSTAMDSHQITRADFMAAAAANLPLDSPFHQLPTGSMFDSVW